MFKRALIIIIMAMAIAAPASAGKPGGRFVPIVRVSPVAAEAFMVEVDAVVDGDTFKFHHDHLDVSITGACRMLGYNAPELKGKERPLGLEASSEFARLLASSGIRVRAEKKDRYGRWLCDAWLEDGTHVNKAMRAWLEKKGYKGVGKYDNLGGVE